MYSVRKNKIKILAFLITLLFIINIIIVSAKAYSNDKISVPIIMYHSVLKDESQAGDYVITPVTLEKDLIYLKDNGYCAILPSDLIDYVENDVKLPEKSVILTFDDGYLNNLTYVLPLLEKYNMKALISIVGSYTETYSESPDPNPYYAYLSYKEINKLRLSQRIEFANHSYNMHSITEKRKGTIINKNESFSDYQNIFIADTINTHYALEEKCLLSLKTYTYPYGFYTEESEKILKGLGYKVTLTCDEKPNYITHDKGCLYLLGRYNRPYNVSTQAFMKKALKN